MCNALGHQFQTPAITPQVIMYANMSHKVPCRLNYTVVNMSVEVAETTGWWGQHVQGGYLVEESSRRLFPWDKLKPICLDYSQVNPCRRNAMTTMQWLQSYDHNAMTTPGMLCITWLLTSYLMSHNETDARCYACSHTHSPLGCRGATMLERPVMDNYQTLWGHAEENFQQRMHEVIVLTRHR